MQCVKNLCKRSTLIFLNQHFKEILRMSFLQKILWIAGALLIQLNEYETRDRSIHSIIKPTFDIISFQDFWRFAQICKKFAAFARKIVFVIFSEQFCYSNKNNFVSKCCKFLANLCKSSEILAQCYICQMMAQVSK